MLEDFYDTFIVKLTGMQVLVAKPGTDAYVHTTHQYTRYYITDEDWRQARVAKDMATSLLHILKPVRVELIIQRSILQQDAFLPRWVVFSL